jgi:soluble lytic murein transglycosylase
LFLLSLNSCAAEQLGADFYEGLRLKAAAESGEDSVNGQKEAAARFEKALISANTHIRNAAAAELLNLHYAGLELPGAVMGRIRQEAAGSWAAALDALNLETIPVKEKVLSFALGSGGAFPDEAVLYVLRECRRTADFFSEAENAAIEGHIAASRSRFAEALAHFRITLAGSPQLFFRYPGLLNDLGRCFQYTGGGANGGEGIDLFLEWEQFAAEGISPEGSAFNGDIGGIRFRLLFFAARIARRLGRVEQGIELFEKARPFAPDSGQADACIWYALDASLGKGIPAAIMQLKAFIPQWHDAAYFADVLEKIARELTAHRRWKELARVFSLIQSNGDAVSRARYAWIIGRSLEEGYFSPEETALAAEAADLPAETGREDIAKAYLRIAYDTGTASFYYRCQSAAVLGKPFLVLPARESGKADRGTSGNTAAMEFLLGFFGNHAAELAPSYIKSFEHELSADNMRTLAEALAKAGLYADSMRLVSVYTNRNGHEIERRDLELMFPRPFRELTEQFAEETGVSPALLYGLIRTESAFQSGIISHAGAVGLTQLMSATAEEMAGRIRRQGGPDYVQEPEESGDGLDLRNPSVNIHIGAAYLAYLIERLEDTLLALLAYNGGMNRIRRWRAADSRLKPGLPVDLFLETIEYPETREYGRKVLAAAAVYRELYYGTDLQKN